MFDLQRRLKLLQRQDTEWEQEQGINVLFLALGLLEWIDDDGERTRAPLLLIPAELKRSSPRDPFRLLRDSDDLEVSATLSYRLSQLGITLPELDLEVPSDYLDRVRQVVSTRQNWAVRDDVFLSTFAYNKLAMWRDLEQLRTEGIKHPLVRQLAGERPNSSPDGSDTTPVAFPADSELKGGKLDDLLTLGDQCTVLKADFSQLRAVEAARRGHNLVVHGPPGTGKSQTITNIIATLIADDKRVLFVSEKRAALDVVKRNIESCGLGVLCLDLHSEFGRKSAVYDQLRNAVEAERAITPIRKERLQELEDIRDKLNAAVRAVHKPRGALGYSVYRMAGRYAELQSLPAAELSVPSISVLTHELYSEIRQACDRLSRCTREFRLGKDSPWLGLRAKDYSVGLADRLRQESGAVARLVSEYRGNSERVATHLGIAIPTTLRDALLLKDVCVHLAQSPGVPVHWLQLPAQRSLETEAHAARTRCDSWSRLRDQIERLFKEDTTETPAAKTLDSLSAIRRDSVALKALLGPVWTEACVVRVDQLRAGCQTLSKALERLGAACEQLTQLVPGARLDTWRSLETTFDQIKAVLELSPVPTEWITAPEETGRLCREYDALATDLDGKFSRLTENYVESVLDHVDDEFALRFRVDYQGVFRLLRPRYWRDLRLLRGHLHTPGKVTFADALDCISCIQAVRKAQSLWSEKEPGGKAAFGHRFEGRRTNWHSLAADIEACRSISRKWLAEHQSMIDLLSGRGDVRLVRSTLDSATDAKSDIKTAVTEVFGTSVAKELPVRQFTSTVQKSAVQLDSIAEACSVLTADSEVDSLPRLVAAYEARKEFDDMDRDFVRQSKVWSSLFGDRFTGVATDWDHLLVVVVEWTMNLTKLLPGNIPAAVAEQAKAPEREPLTEWIEQLSEGFTERLSKEFDETETKWHEWKSAEWPALIDWLAFVEKNAEQASEHIEYGKSCAHLSKAIGSDPVEALRSKTDDATVIPNIVDRQIVGAWIDAANRDDPALAEFTGSEQRSLRDRFRDLDSRFPVAVRQEVLRKGFERYPHSSSLNADTGQVGLLKKELAKKRRQLPVRKLLKQLPTLIGRLKPCMLMSPLAVSQFLPLTTDYFDAVVFDEASQVFPEDGVPSIARAAKVIVVGDRKQLPPTNFFRRSDEEEILDDDDVTEDADRFIGSESILDAMVGLVGQGQVGEQYLRVHYRSHAEVLIQFSNQTFYSERPLVVFPDAGLNEVSSPVRSVYVPNGLYEVGKRINHHEAVKVVDLVCELMDRYGPERSIGVVALSRAQSNYIDEQLELRRTTRRDLDVCFAGSLDEPFFVKNLENVQGDERDHIILSVGYGSLTAGGTVPNRFGPLNRDGGERRLNVAISRARHSMTVVHSLKPSDIVSQVTGAQLLKQYLEYVEQPTEYFLTRTSEDGGETESPFEDAVASALSSRGYEVVPQVGVAGYRVDLGVRSPNGTGYVLGIECDGFTYHATPAARDRDWLRQSVLEGLGWKIHRVWSTAWIRNPTGELKEIERAIKDAVEAQEIGRPARTIQDSQVSQGDELLESKPVSAHTGGEARSIGRLFDHYEYADLSQMRVDTTIDLRAAGTYLLRPLVTKIVETEAPVHFEQIAERIRHRWGLKRTGAAIGERIKTAVSSLAKDGTIEWAPALSTRRVADRFLVKPGVESRPRRPKLEEPARSIDHVSDPEIAAGVLVVARAIHGGRRADIVQQTAREFGYKRTGGHIDDRIGQVIDDMLRDTVLRQVNEIITAD